MAGVPAAGGREQEGGADQHADDVEQGGRVGGGEEAALRVEHAGPHGAEADEDQQRHHDAGQRGGLGDLGIRYGYQRFMPEVMVTVVVLLIVLVQGVQMLGDSLARRLNRRAR